jgi:hypothetical protein
VSNPIKSSTSLLGNENIIQDIGIMERVHAIELSMTKKVGEIKSDIKVLENKVIDLCSSVTRLHRTFYGTFIAAFLTYIVDKFI